jgi:hypothetical protein
MAAYKMSLEELCKVLAYKFAGSEKTRFIDSLLQEDPNLFNNITRPNIGIDLERFFILTTMRFLGVAFQNEPLY